MNAKQIKELILKNKGKFFTVEFVKKNGEIRSINGQVGIKEDHLGWNTVSHIPKYVTVAENLGGGKYQYRNVNTETITRIAIAGKVYFNK